MSAAGKKNEYIPPTPSSEWARITPKVFEAIAKLVKELTGIHLNQSKLTMLESRLVKRLRETNIPSHQEYFEYLLKNESETQHFINVITTNKTEFFREDYHFQFLTSNFIPEHHQNKKNAPIRIWSAASSSGQEAYTIGITFFEYFANSTFNNFRIIGTDIDTDMISTAENGVYRSDLVTAHVPPHLIKKYFRQGTGRNAGFYKVSGELQEISKFRLFNLIKDEFPVPIKFDVIFLRNVLIYFDLNTIQTVIAKMYRYLNTGGYLLIGHSETLNEIKHDFKSLGSAVYKKVK